MTIRVIYRDPKAVREVTCSECAALLAYVPADETRGERSIVLVAGVALVTCALALAIVSEPTLLHALTRGASALWRSL